MHFRNTLGLLPGLEESKTITQVFSLQFAQVCLCPEGERCQGGDVSDRAELVLVTAGRRTEHKQRCNQYRHIGATISAIVILQICLIQLSTAFRDIHSAR